MENNVLTSLHKYQETKYTETSSVLNKLLLEVTKD